MDKYKDIPKDQWVEILEEDLTEKGITKFVYIPFNYPGPIAIDAKIIKPLPNTFSNESTLYSE